MLLVLSKRVVLFLFELEGHSCVRLYWLQHHKGLISALALENEMPRRFLLLLHPYNIKQGCNFQSTIAPLKLMLMSNSEPARHLSLSECQGHEGINRASPPADCIPLVCWLSAGAERQNTAATTWHSEFNLFSK